MRNSVEVNYDALCYAAMINVKTNHESFNDPPSPTLDFFDRFT